MKSLKFSMFFLSRVHASTFGQLLQPPQEPVLSDLGIGYVVDCGTNMGHMTAESRARLHELTETLSASAALRGIADSCKEGPYGPFASYFSLIADVAEKAELRPELLQRHVSIFFALLSDRPDEREGALGLPSRAAVCSAIGYEALRELRQKNPPRQELIHALLAGCHLIEQLIEAAHAELKKMPVIVCNPTRDEYFERVGQIDRPMMKMEAERLVQRERLLTGLVANLNLDLRYVLSRAPLVLGWEPAMTTRQPEGLLMTVEVGTDREAGEAGSGS